MSRLRQLLFLGSFIPWCWLAMMAVHELGHVLAAWATGGTVTDVVLHPLAISRTDVHPNPEPLLVAWAGPVVGVFLPLATWILWHGRSLPGEYMPRWFAGFCLVANGTYLGIGSFNAVGDAGEIIRHGSPRWLLWGFGLLTCAAGIGLWHKSGPHFGINASNEVDATAMRVSILLLASTLVVLFSFF